MAFEDLYRVGAHAVITNNKNSILMLKANYGHFGWGLPGGAVDKGETVHQALLRECLEELGLVVRIDYLSGLYYHHAFNAHTAIFRCHFVAEKTISLSSEHTEYQYFSVDELSPMQRQRVLDCLNFDGQVKSAIF